MKYLSTLIFFLLFSIDLPAQQHVAENQLTYRKGELLLLLHHDADVYKMAKAHTEIGARVIKRITPGMNMWLIGYDAILINDEEAKELMSHDEAVQLAQFNHTNIVEKSRTPNDSLYSLQWDMDKVSAPQAWSLDTGGMTSTGTPVVIASIDGGFDVTHPDLNIWHNNNEIPGNGIDDDQNGYIDDYHGWNSSAGNDSIPVGNGHGTATIGISSAHGNNGFGICGVNWNVQAMAVSTDIYYEPSVLAAYAYIFSQRKVYNETNGAKGAFVVATNSSFGPSGLASQYPLWNAMYDSMGSVGILSAGATSNDPNCNTDSCPDIPSQCPSAYTVITTGTNAADVRHGGYGLRNVDLAAPGNGSYTITNGGGYGGFGGTSAASPHVAGAIALMWSAACPKMIDDYKLYPDSLALIMKNYLLNGVDTLTALAGKTVSGGRLNLFKAVTNVRTYDCAVATRLADMGETLSAIDVYPNPADQLLNIHSESEITSVVMYDYLGQMMDASYRNSNLYMEKVPSGFYLLEIKDSNNNIFIKKIVRK